MWLSSVLCLHKNSPRHIAQSVSVILLPSTAFAVFRYSFRGPFEFLLRHNPSHIHWIMNNVPYRPFHPYLSPLRRYLPFIQIVSHTDEANSRSNRLKYLPDESSFRFNLDQFTLSLSNPYGAAPLYQPLWLTAFCSFFGGFFGWSRAKREDGSSSPQCGNDGEVRRNSV